MKAYANKAIVLARASSVLPRSDRAALGKALKRAGVVRTIRPSFSVLADHPVGFSRASIQDVDLALKFYNETPDIECSVKFAPNGKLVVSRLGVPILQITKNTPDCVFTGELPHRSDISATIRKLGGFIKDNPAWIDAHYLKAALLAKSGDLESSIGILRGLLGSEKNNPVFKSKLSELLTLKGHKEIYYNRFMDAYDSYLEALDLYPGNKKAMIGVLETAEETGNIELIIKSLLKLSYLGHVKDAIAGLNDLILKSGSESEKIKKILINLLIEFSEDAVKVGDPDAAIVYLDEALKVDDSIELKEQKAEILYNFDRIDEAYNILKSLAENDFLSASSLSILSLICIKRGEHKNALRYSNYSGRRDSQNDSAMYFKGKALLELGDIFAARKYLRMAAKAFVGAMDLFETCEALLPLVEKGGDLDVSDLLGMRNKNILLLSKALKNIRCHSGALVCYSAMLKQNPNDTDALLGIARSHYFWGKGREAEETLRKVLEIDPINESAFKDLVHLLRDQGREDEQGRFIKEMLSKSPRPIVYSYAGLFLRDRGEIANAILLFEKAVELNPHDQMSRLKLIKLLIKDKQLEKAMQHCEIGSDLAPKLFNFPRKKASILLSYKQYERAIEVLEDLYYKMLNVDNKGIETRSNIHWIKVRLAEVYMDVGNAESCRRWFDLAKTSFFEDRDAERILEGVESWLLSKEEISG